EEDVAVGLVTPRIASARERALQRRLEQLRKEATPRLVDPLVGQLVGASDVWAWWQEWELDQRRAALRAVTREIRVLPARVPGRSTRPPVEEMVRVVCGPGGGRWDGVPRGFVAWGNPFRGLCEICAQNFAFWGAVQNEPVISKNSS